MNWARQAYVSRAELICRWNESFIDHGAELGTEKIYKKPFRECAVSRPILYVEHESEVKSDQQLGENPCGQVKGQI